MSGSCGCTVQAWCPPEKALQRARVRSRLEYPFTRNRRKSNHQPFIMSTPDQLEVLQHLIRKTLATCFGIDRMQKIIKFKLRTTDGS